MSQTSIADLSVAEKLQLVEDLWDDIASQPEAIPVSEWQKEELARRKANLLAHPASGLSWEEVKRQVRSRHGRWCAERNTDEAIRKPRKEESPAAKALSGL